MDPYGAATNVSIDQSSRSFLLASSIISEARVLVSRCVQKSSPDGEDVLLGTPTVSEF
jgi:hypothetical protein